jgi:hypothetical protein
MSNMTKLNSLINQYIETKKSLHKEEKPEYPDYVNSASSFEYDDHLISLQTIIENTEFLIKNPIRLKELNVLLIAELSEQENEFLEKKVKYDDWVEKIERPLKASLINIEKKSVALFFEIFPNAIAYKSSFPKLSIEEIDEISNKLAEFDCGILKFNHDKKHLNFIYSFEENENHEILISKKLLDKIKSPIKIKKGNFFDIRDFYDLNKHPQKIKSHTHTVSIDMNFLITHQLILPLNFYK